MGKNDASKEQARQAELARQQQQQQFETMMKPTKGEDRFEKGAANFDKWLKAKNYSSSPDESTMLNFDLWNPAHVAKQRERMGDLTGIGAANMGGTGDQSIALQLTREKNANIAGEEAGAAWENAVKGTDAYYKTGDMQWSQLQRQTQGNLLNNATSREMGYNRGMIDTRPPSLLPMLLGGASVWQYVYQKIQTSADASNPTIVLSGSADIAGAAAAFGGV